MDAQNYLKGVNSKPNINISVHLTGTDTKNIDLNLSALLSNVDGKKYRVLSIANVDFYITENQAEQIFKTMETKLYEETFAELEEKYLAERVRRKHLEEELELLKERLREVV